MTRLCGGALSGRAIGTGLHSSCRTEDQRRSHPLADPVLGEDICARHGHARVASAAPTAAPLQAQRQRGLSVSCEVDARTHGLNALRTISWWPVHAIVGRVEGFNCCCVDRTTLSGGRLFRPVIMPAVRIGRAETADQEK